MPEYKPDFEINAMTKMRECAEERELRAKMDARSLTILEPIIAAALGGDPAWRPCHDDFAAYLNSFGRGLTYPRSVLINRGKDDPVRIWYDNAAYLADPHPLSVEASHMLAFRLGEHTGCPYWILATKEGVARRQGGKMGKRESTPWTEITTTTDAQARRRRFVKSIYFMPECAVRIEAVNAATAGPPPDDAESGAFKKWIDGLGG